MTQQDSYWNEIIEELLCLKQASDERGNHTLFQARLKLMKNKYKLKLRKK